jgi:hypothetical protein
MRPAWARQSGSVSASMPMPGVGTSVDQLFAETPDVMSFLLAAFAEPGSAVGPKIGPALIALPDRLRSSPSPLDLRRAILVGKTVKVTAGVPSLFGMLKPCSSGSSTTLSRSAAPVFGRVTSVSFRSLHLSSHSFAGSDASSWAAAASASSGRAGPVLAALGRAAAESARLLDERPGPARAHLLPGPSRRSVLRQSLRRYREGLRTGDS